MLRISPVITIPDSEIEIRGVQASGPGGQNVNKVASAAHLFFNFKDSSLPLYCRNRLQNKVHRWITDDGIIVIKARNHRTFEKNRQEALKRLRTLILQAIQPEKVRKPTRASRASKERRLEAKRKQSNKKALRRAPEV